jgi:hypothetical protein
MLTKLQMKLHRLLQVQPILSNFANLMFKINFIFINVVFLEEIFLRQNRKESYRLKNTMGFRRGIDF